MLVLGCCVQITFVVSVFVLRASKQPLSKRGRWGGFVFCKPAVLFNSIHRTHNGGSQLVNSRHMSAGLASTLGYRWGDDYGALV